MVGSTCTIFIGNYPNQRARNRSSIFVAGKFDELHHLTPHRIELDDEEAVSCAATTASHTIVCCKTAYYAIGDNQRNQLGLGPAMLGLSQMKRIPLAKMPSVGAEKRESEIRRCATSNNHTVILTHNGFLVSRANSYSIVFISKR